MICVTVFSSSSAFDTLMLPGGRVTRRIREEAEKLGVTPEEYLVELLLQGLDPKNKAVEYIEAAKELLDEARGELEEGDVRQAAEKVWGAAALAVKAYAYWRDGKRLASHGELWEYSKKLIDELGERVSDAWSAGNAMHTCFYEGWCTRRDVEEVLERVERLVKGGGSQDQERLGSITPLHLFSAR